MADESNKKPKAYPTISEHLALHPIAFDQRSRVEKNFYSSRYLAETHNISHCDVTWCSKIYLSLRSGLQASTSLICRSSARCLTIPGCALFPLQKWSELSSCLTSFYRRGSDTVCGLSRDRNWIRAVISNPRTSVAKRGGAFRGVSFRNKHKTAPVWLSLTVSTRILYYVYSGSFLLLLFWGCEYPIS